MDLSLNSVTKVTYTNEEDVWFLDCNITDFEGRTYDCIYTSRPDDTFGLNPTIREWLLNNPEFPKDPYVPPTIEEERSSMPQLSARQFRLGLVAGGIHTSQVDFAINQMVDGPEKNIAQIEWEYATVFARTHPLIDTLSAALGLTPEAVDTMWLNAVNL